MNLIKHPLKTIFLLLFTGIIGWFGYEGYVNYTGYCKAEERFLSDEELIKLAISDVHRTISRNQPEVFNVNYEEYLELEDKKESINYYLEQNPDCCNVMRSWEEYWALETTRRGRSSEGFYHPTLGGRVFGDESHLVQIKFTRVSENSSQTPDMAYSMLGNCGQVKDYD